MSELHTTPTHQHTAGSARSTFDGNPRSGRSTFDGKSFDNSSTNASLDLSGKVSRKSSPGGRVSFNADLASNGAGADSEANGNDGPGSDDEEEGGAIMLQLSRASSSPFLLSHNLTDTDVVTLLKHLQTNDFNAWACSSDRTKDDFKSFVHLARSLGKAGVLGDDSPLSSYAQITFWQVRGRIMYKLRLKPQLRRISSEFCSSCAPHHNVTHRPTPNLYLWASPPCCRISRGTSLVCSGTC